MGFGLVTFVSLEGLAGVVIVDLGWWIALLGWDNWDPGTGCAREVARASGPRGTGVPFCILDGRVFSSFFIDWRVFCVLTLRSVG